MSILATIKKFFTKEQTDKVDLEAFAEKVLPANFPYPSEGHAFGNSEKAYFTSKRYGYVSVDSLTGFPRDLGLCSVVWGKGDFLDITSMECEDDAVGIEPTGWQSDGKGTVTAYCGNRAYTIRLK